MVVGEPPLPSEPGDPQEAGHRALARRQDGTDQQQLGAAPRPLLQEHRREGSDEGGEAGWQAWHGGVSRRGWGSPSLPPAPPASKPPPPLGRAPEPPPNRPKPALRGGFPPPPGWGPLRGGGAP